MDTTTAAPPVEQTAQEEWHDSQAGQRFNLHDDRWQLSARMSVNVGLIRRLCWSPGLADGAVRTLAEFAGKAAGGTVIAASLAVRRFLTFAPAYLRTAEISPALMLSYRDFCRTRDEHDHEVSSYLRPFLVSWKKLGHPGISKALVDMMQSWTLKQPERGVAVNRLDADAGPLMPDEHVAVVANWCRVFERGEMLLGDFVMARLVDITGRRPLQIMQLKLRDMDDSSYENVEPGCSARRILKLKIPRIKGKGSGWRQRFRAVTLSADTWNLLVMQRDAVHASLDAFLERTGLSLQSDELAAIRADMPLVPAWQAAEPDAKRLQVFIEMGEHGAAVLKLRSLMESDAWHAQPLRVAMALKAVPAPESAERSGESIDVSPRRLRYTREFELERANCSPPVIAWLLDHSSTESLVSYSRNGPDRARSIGSAMALKLMPFVTIFQGRVVAAEADAESGDDPEASRILFPGVEGGATCAVKRNCGMMALPRPCYNGCPQFQPWVDGPHEEYLESLLEEREEALQILRPIEDRAMIEAGDSLIMSVVQVIRLCDKERAKMAEQNREASGRRARRGPAQ